MELIQPAVPQLVRAGTLMAAANTPAPQELRSGVEYGFRGPDLTGWGTYPPDLCEDDPPDGDTVAQVVGGARSGHTFVVFADADCTAMSMRYPDLAARAQGLLDVVEGAAIAREFWAGTLAGNATWSDESRLTGATDVTPGGGAVSIAEGVGLLEEQVPDMLGAGVPYLHTTRRVATLASARAGLIRREGDLILTVLDTRLVADAGYPGTGPDGDPPSTGEAWIYATARPTVLRGQSFTNPGSEVEALDRSTNRIKVRAHRPAMVILPAPVVAAVRVTLSEG